MHTQARTKRQFDTKAFLVIAIVTIGLSLVLSLT